MRNKLGLPDMLTFDTRSSFEKLLAYHLGNEKSRECMDKLLGRYGSLSTVFSASEDEICRVAGVGMSTALLIKLVAYVNSRRITDKFEFGRVHTELELREYVGALFLGTSVESVYVILLDNNGRTVHAEHVSDGTVNASDVLPRKILECANKRKATQIIVAHSHPKGTVSPSKDDIITTGRLINMFSSVGVKLRAHYIVSDGEIGKVDLDMLYGTDFRS